MALSVSLDRLRFIVSRFRERLWVRPLAVCLLSIAAAFVAKLADGTPLDEFVPEVTSESIEMLLSVMAASMLVIATFSVASMISAYASVSSTATPRAFSLVVADDASQYALSAFVGSFIFSIVALTAVKNGFFETAGLFILFVLTAFVFSVVIVTFVRWVDGIARLGRLGSTMDKVEKATAEALTRRRNAPNLCGVPVRTTLTGEPVFAARSGYVQHINVAALQAWAEKLEARVVVVAIPGTFATPDRPLAYLIAGNVNLAEDDGKRVTRAFQVGTERVFDYDPRFGLVVLSQIAGRALSPAVNDPGTAIDIIGRLVRLFEEWSEPRGEQSDNLPSYDRVEVPAVSARDLFDDAFTAVARDGAGIVEVSVWLQKALCTLASLGDEDMKVAARQHGHLALERSSLAMDLPEDLAAVREAHQKLATTKA